MIPMQIKNFILVCSMDKVGYPHTQLLASIPWLMNPLHVLSWIDWKVWWPDSKQAFKIQKIFEKTNKITQISKETTFVLHSPFKAYQVNTAEILVFLWTRKPCHSSWLCTYIAEDSLSVCLKYCFISNYQTFAVFFKVRHVMGESLMK